MSDVYVLGIDMIKFGRFPDESPATLGAKAALMALDDAGLNIGDVQALYNGCLLGAGAQVGQQILAQIGQTGIPVAHALAQFTTRIPVWPICARICCPTCAPAPSRQPL